VPSVSCDTSMSVACAMSSDFMGGPAVVADVVEGRCCHGGAPALGVAGQGGAQLATEVRSAA
jgi:hypothetical protein